MGCFSFICQECGQPILSDSVRGEKVELFLLKNGEVIDQMRGEYDSYGRVFTEDREDSLKWNLPWAGSGEDKGDVCTLMFDEDESNGIAAVHSRCYRGYIPTERSMEDPNQGWGYSGIHDWDLDEDQSYLLDDEECECQEYY